MEGTRPKGGEEAVYAAGPCPCRLKTGRQYNDEAAGRPESPPKIKAAGGRKPSCCLPLLKMAATTLACKGPSVAAAKGVQVKRALKLWAARDRGHFLACSEARFWGGARVLHAVTLKWARGLQRQGRMRCFSRAWFGIFMG
ncbi:hypothetical protein [Thermanaeromonas sp.]|uniref:hypothetical protein n=1 Tax=Thermanaeromonas sp. TaxID=2003697 RepID=UPI002621C13E|nr:hypothetical protein [Thermanaeromonas sp.]